MPGRRSTPYNGKGGYDIFATWYADLVAPLLEQDSLFSVVDGDLEHAPIDEPSNGYHYPRDSRKTPLSNYMAMDHILRNCTPPLAASLDAYTNNAAKALRYIRRNWGQASTQDAALPPPTPSHQPPSSPSDDGDSSSPPTPTSDGEPSDLRAFEDAAAAADLLRGAIPMLNAWGINVEVNQPVPPGPRPPNRFQEVTTGSNAFLPSGSSEQPGPVENVEAMTTMSQDAPTHDSLPHNWSLSLHPKTLEMTLATNPTLIELPYQHGDGLVCYTTGLECHASPSASGLYTTSLYQPSPSDHPDNDLPDHPWYPEPYTMVHHLEPAGKSKWRQHLPPESHLQPQSLAHMNTMLQTLKMLFKDS
eukprot:gene7321-biopygen17131